MNLSALHEKVFHICFYVTRQKRRKLLIIYQAEMEKIQSTQESEHDSQSVDAFASVMRAEHPGRVRLYGLGVTKTVLKRKMKDFGPSLNDTEDKMQQKMEEMEERWRKW
ncbi:uncharacterized protein LOC107766055 [Nicotiana tabacum]|uniref:Uncharacterized protein LOC107766055 n=1 Tax=Nicotiana tabacum TaxID=4097 RepID=A0A1S3XJU9_TOBAC|nr:PREDICTED: uncharacterized protein LOC107766055 [Nicotiana tabacum]